MNTANPMLPVASAMVVRRYPFDLQTTLGEDWFGGDRLRTIIANALSIPLPSGERMFIRALRQYFEAIEDPQLREEVKIFFKQESSHTQEHVKYNRWVCQHRGYDLAQVEAPYKDHNEYLCDFAEPRLLLATTVCMEHLTAIVSHLLISEPGWLSEAKPAVRDFWLWHSVEEIEHKAVAFDVYRQLVGDKSYLDEIMRRTVIQLAQNLRFTVCQMFLMEGGRPRDARKWLDTSPFLQGECGLLAAINAHIEDFYRADFHPWDHDNRHLIDLVSVHLNQAFA
ncbi:metal-dependent hydrolase [Pseudomonas promysalinigenes]|uniref:Metal-dependent hydrolase n=1 Tax=Pseudomonas putida TaxID=303 RepID=G8AA87_PSEPU|nr:metal-dependent hydrolase [Pseudomonas promysalinigenes]ADQ74617.1 metal-dependent hydrolase [Pseudomonas putida]QXI32362.1 metal-dependent hydrolase [Pseudomonas promysalinigenes]